MSSRRFGAITATLSDGRVLIAGGLAYFGHGGVQESDTADIFDPKTGLFRYSGKLTGDRTYGLSVLLPDDKILMVGGFSAEIYDPDKGGSEPLEWSEDLPSLSKYLSGTVGAISLLPSGDVLITSGEGAPGYAATADPNTGEVTRLDDMPVGRVRGRSALLPDGRVLIFGGSTAGADPQPQVQTVFFDPADESFSLGPKQVVPRFGAATAVLSDGRVFISGGELPSNGSREPRLLRSAEIFDPTTGRFELTGAPRVPRVDGLATQLSDGRILVTGGNRGNRFGKVVGVSELYDPDTGTFRRTGNPARTRPAAALVALPGGRAILAGGMTRDSEITVRRSAEVFMPDRFNPKVRIRRVVAPRRTVKFGQRFRIFVRIVNRGRGIGRKVSVCVAPDWGRRFETLHCQRKVNIKPGAARWAVIKGSFRVRNKAVIANPNLLVKKKIRILVKAHGLRLVQIVAIKARRR